MSDEEPTIHVRFMRDEESFAIRCDRDGRWWQRVNGEWVPLEGEAATPDGSE